MHPTPAAMATNEQIADFWDAFQRRADKLALAASADDPVYGELLAALQRIDSGLFLEFCARPGDSELIVTAEGDRALFPLARAVVARAPAVPGWTLTALKPRLGVPASVTWESLALDTEDIMVEPLGRSADGWRLRVLVADLRDDQLEDARHAVLRALDHVLGEERFAETVADTEVAPLPPGTDARGFLSLEDLESYLSGR